MTVFWSASVVSLTSSDIPQANDPERVLRLARHLATAGSDQLPAEFAHPRDRLFYLGALRTLGAIDEHERATERLATLAAASSSRKEFAKVFATSRVGAAWLAWSGAATLTELDPSTAAEFLVASSGVSATTAERRASTLRRWLAWCVSDHRADPAASTDERRDESSPASELAVDATPEPPRVVTTRVDPNRLLAGLARARAQLQLDTIDLCFITALYLRGDRSALVSFEDEALMDVFEQVCELVDPGAENPRKRATHAIQRLRDDRLLQRVDGAGLVRSGEYTLTGLAAAIADFFVRDEALTKESLVLLTRVLHLNLTEIRNRARTAKGDGWRTQVVGPLSVTIRDLVDGIRRRQRGLDAQQEEVQEQIGTLLHEKWFEAIETCQRLLDTTSSTLRELNEVLLRDTHQFIGVLQEIQQLSEAAGADEAHDAAQRVIEQVDVIAAWGSARQRAWSEYYQYVHRFLQDVVRLDPDRALSQRLRDLVARFAERPFSLVTAEAPSIVQLRPIEARTQRTPVTRDHEDRDREVLEVPVEDRRKWIEERVFEAIASGATTLSEITSEVVGTVDARDRFLYAGWVAKVVADLAFVMAERQRPWAAVDFYELEDWSVEGLLEEP
jgi:chromosome partition protein MukF